MLTTQKKVNDICDIIKRKGEEVTISKVRVLINDQNSFCALADKVLLFKKNPKLARKLALKSQKFKAIENSKNLTKLIYDLLKYLNIPDDFSTIFFFQTKIHKFIEDSINTKIKTIQDRLKQTQTLNDHIETRYYGLKARYTSLISKYLELKDSHNRSHKNLKNIISLRKQRVVTDEIANKKVKVRDYQSQIKLLLGECCAAYNAERNQIVLKVPMEHAIVRELKKSSSSIYLCANATFDYTNKYWLLDTFEAKTIILLMRNRFIISKELSLVFKYLQKTLTKTS